MKPALRLFVFYFAASFISASCGYYALHMFMSERGVFGSLYRMFLYHEEHPLPYIAIVSLSYACVATFAVTKWRHLAGWRRRVLAVAIIFISVTLASIPGGMLWVVHDMMAGFVPNLNRAIDYLLWGALAGLQVGWIVVGLSLPYSLLGAVLGYVVTIKGFEMSFENGK